MATKPRAIEELRARALAYPEAREDFPWGHIAVKVRGKTFVFLSDEGGQVSVTCKLPASHGAALLLPFASPTGYGLGKSGWVTASFPPAAEPPIALLVAWIDESYRAVAPKTLAAQVGGANEMSRGTGSKAGAAKAVAQGERLPADDEPTAATRKVLKAAAKKAAARGAEGKLAAAKKAAKKVVKQAVAKVQGQRA